MHALCVAPLSRVHNRRLQEARPPSHNGMRPPTKFGVPMDRVSCLLNQSYSRTDFVKTKKDVELIGRVKRTVLDL